MKKGFLNNKKFKDDKINIIKILFPLYPIKLFRSTLLMIILAILISIRVVMNFISIPIPQFGMSLSVAHTPLIIIGWFFGPVIGFFTGIVTDTICYFAKPTSVWFWLYAIQEPLLGMMAGFVGSFYLLGKDNNFKYEAILSKIFLYIFVIFTLLIILFYAVPNNNFQGNAGLVENDFFSIYKYLAIGVIIFFLIIYEISYVYFLKKKKENKRMLLYISNITFLNAIIFSFLLGTISAVEYTKIFFPNNNNYIKYGAMFYVIPRVIKESIKTPIQIFLLFSIIIAITPSFQSSLNKISLSWENNKTK